MPVSGETKLVLLLTATVNPRSTILVERNDPVQRLDDYKTALQNCWLNGRATTHLILCENSGYDLDEIRKLYNGQAKRGGRLELLSFEEKESTLHLGKGYGEIGIIAHALRHSKHLQVGNPLIVKSTGRLIVRNLAACIEAALRETPFDIACDLRGNLRWADSRFFMARKDFLQRYLVPLQTLVDDSRGVTFEHVLGRAVSQAIGDGLRWIPMPCTPDFRGFSGTSNVPYPSSWFSWCARDVFRRMKNWAMAR